MSAKPWENDDGSTNVEGFLEAYAKDDNTFWRADSGHIQNVLDEVVDYLGTLWTITGAALTHAPQRVIDLWSADDVMIRGAGLLRGRDGVPGGDERERDEAEGDEESPRAPREREDRRDDERDERDD